MPTNSSISAPISNLHSGETPQAARKNWAAMLLASAALMVAWSFAVPVYEGPDEPAHWLYARYLNQHRALPRDSPDCPEAANPPLYYLLIAPLADEVRLPPIGWLGEEYGAVNRHFLFPPRAYQNASGDFGLYWPFRAARLISVLLSVFTIWFCALAGTEASGSPVTGLLVGGVVAFWPMFTFRGMNVSNDSLMTMLSALSVYLIVRLIKRGFTWRIGIYAGLAVAGAFLTRINAVVLVVPLVLAVISERAPWRARLLRAAVLGAIMLVVVAPWLIRNEQLYGELLAQNAQFTLGSGRIGQYRQGLRPYFLTYFPLVFVKSFIGYFGWLTLQLPFSSYVAYTVGLVGAGACWVAGVWQKRIDFRLSAVLSSLIVMNLIAVIQINFTFRQPQGRFMFPALPAIALLLGLGLESRRSWSEFCTKLTVGGLALSNLIMLATLVIPAYWPPVIIR